MKWLFHVLLIVGILLVMAGVMRDSAFFAISGAILITAWGALFTVFNPIETGPDDFPPMIF